MVVSMMLIIAKYYLIRLTGPAANSTQWHQKAFTNETNEAAQTPQLQAELFPWRSNSSECIHDIHDILFYH